MKLFPAGIGPIHVVRLVQWTIAFPVIWSFLVGLLRLDLIDPLMTLGQTFGLSTTNTRWALFAIAVGLEISEQRVDASEDRFTNHLHQLIKTIGDEVKEGSAIETAVSQAAKAGGGPAALFREALDASRDMPFQSALITVANTSGNTYFQEVSHLLAMAVDSPGDTGQAIRDLGTELEKSYGLSSALTSHIYSSLVVLKGTALIAVPPMYRLLSYTFYQSLAGASEDATLSVDIQLEAASFFAYGAIITASLDGIVFDRWARIPARIPLALSLVYGGLSYL